MKTLASNKYFKDLAFLFFLTLIVYWPLSTNFLSLKNDALVQYLAFRYHLSEAIQQGYFPFWSPYLYTGFPMHADIQGEVWNPIVLFLSAVSKYDMTILQWEVLIYLYLSAAGMYRLVKYLGLSRATAICCGIAFMSCGYMTDSISVIPWIASAAFIPFVLLYLLRSLRSALFTDALKFSIAVSGMFLCGYPSFFIYLNYIIGISLLAWLIYQVRNSNGRTAWTVLVHFVMAYLFFLMICSPAILSYYEFLPYYPRGSGLAYHTAGENPLLPYSLFTYLLPNVAGKANFMATDLSMRNTYIGAFTFIFFLSSLRTLNRFKIIVLVFTLFSLLFSLGDLTPVQKICNSLLPGMKMFRHPGTTRIFTSIGMIVLAAYSLDAFLKKELKKGLQWLAYFCLLALVLWCLYFIARAPVQVNPYNLSLNPSALKQFFYAISFQKFAVVIGVLQLLFISGFLLVQRRKIVSQKLMVALITINSIAFAWIGLPFTVVSQYKTSEVNAYIHSFPGGYPAPDLNRSIESEVYSDSAAISPYGYPNFYDKKITIQDHIITPTLNADYNLFLGNKTLRQQLKDHPFVYVSKDSISIQPSTIRILKFTPDKFVFQVKSTAAGALQLFQQFNPNWYARVNRQPAEIKKSNVAFMSVHIPAGASVVEWQYTPVKVYWGMIVSVLSLLTVFSVLYLKRKVNKSYE